jgi:hypothetical protein
VCAREAQPRFSAAGILASDSGEKWLDALAVELDAALNGTYLGDNDNDVPSSFQHAPEAAVSRPDL